MAKETSSKPIKTSMPSTFPATGTARVMAKGPRKLAKGEKSNQVSRPPKR